MPEWLSTMLVMLNESWMWFGLALVVSLLIIRFIWKKLKRTVTKVIALALTLPLSLGVGFMDTAHSLADDYKKSDGSISKLYEYKKAELFDTSKISLKK